jgi:hypothetical protein
MLCQSTLHAGVIWNWSFGGTEAGTFTTSGSLADTVGSGTHNFGITDFSVTASTLPGLIGRPYNEGSQPGTGFIWDKGLTRSVEFYRDGGAFTNGSNLYVVDSNTTSLMKYLFFANNAGQFGSLEDPDETPVVGFSTLSLSPSSSPAVPEPSTLAIFGIGAGIAGLKARKKKRVV